MGIHTGTPQVSEEGYIGVDVRRAARIAACAHGGQVLISSHRTSSSGRDGLRDLGHHRLKDLSEPERIYQLGEEEFPPARESPPDEPADFRQRRSWAWHELAEALARAVTDDVRLLTLTGPGGTRKIPPGAADGAELTPRYPDGVWWVPLAPLRDPQARRRERAQALGADDGLAAHVADKSLLIVFDNFEQVVDAAAEVAALLTDLSEPRPARDEQGTASSSAPSRCTRCRRSCQTTVSPSSWPARGRSSPTSRATAPSPRSAGGSTTCRSRSSSPPRASRHSRPGRSSSACRAPSRS